MDPKLSPIGKGAMNFRSLDYNITYTTLIDIIEQSRVRDVLRASGLNQSKQSKQKQADDHPQSKVSKPALNPMVHENARMQPPSSG